MNIFTLGNTTLEVSEKITDPFDTEERTDIVLPVYDECYKANPAITS